MISIQNNDEKNPLIYTNTPKDETSGKNGDNNAPNNPVLNTSDVIGHTFLMPHQKDGQKFQVCIVRIIDYQETKWSQDPGQIQFAC